MNITRAFIERNRLKKYINQISAILQTVPVFHEKALENPNLKLTEGKPIDSIIDEIIEAKHYLGLFNYAIDEANMKGSRKLLDELETVKSQIVSVQDVVRRAKSFKEVDAVMTENGTLLKREYVADVDVEHFSDKLKSLQKKERDLEDKISALNSSTEVVLSENLKKYLESYNN